MDAKHKECQVGTPFSFPSRPGMDVFILVKDKTSGERRDLRERGQVRFVCD